MPTAGYIRGRPYIPQEPSHLFRSSEATSTAEQGPPPETESRLGRVAEDVAELKGELRQIDRCLSAIEQGQQDLRKSVEQGQQGLHKDVRQVLYLVIAGILIPILLQLVRQATQQ